MLTIKTFLIVCPMVFLAGFVDAIGGGGGLISLPAYLFAGLPSHTAIACNKLSSTCGTAVATAGFIKNKLIDLKLAIPTAAAALLGAFMGARLSLLADEKILQMVLLPVLCCAAFFVLNRKIFDSADREEALWGKKTCMIATIGALIIGLYDGFYGPGTGTFLIIVLHVFARLSVSRANAQAKAINLTSNVTSLVVFIMNGQVIWTLGLCAALFNMAGNYLGARLSIRSGSKITRPIILIVLAILFVKIIFGL